MLIGGARGVEVMASTGKGGENIVLSNTNKRAETEMVLAVSVGKLLERTVGPSLHSLGMTPNPQTLTLAQYGGLIRGHH